MSEIDYTGVALVVTALGTLVTAVGIAIVAVITARHKKVTEQQTKVIAQVEQQGNSVALEQKRVTAVALRLLATNKPMPEYEMKADDAEKVYEEALAQSKIPPKLP